MNHILDAEAIYLGPGEMKGLRRRLRLFSRQYSLLTEAQKMD